MDSRLCPHSGAPTMEATIRSSPRRLLKKLFWKGLEKMEMIDKITLQVALKRVKILKAFHFLEAARPRLVLRLTVGPMAFNSIQFPVADEELMAEDLVIGLPVLKQLGADTKTLFEKNRDTLDGRDCSAVWNITTNARDGHVSRMIISRQNSIFDHDETTKVSEDDQSFHSHVNCYTIRNEEDTSPVMNLLDPLDQDQCEEISVAVEEMIQTASNHGLPDAYIPTLEQLITVNINIFRVSLSAEPPANIPPLKIGLVSDATPPYAFDWENTLQIRKNFFQVWEPNVLHTEWHTKIPLHPARLRHC